MSHRFQPLPFLSNPHVQTIVASLFRGPADLRFRKHHLVLPDGDHLLLYDSLPVNWKPGDAMVLLVHGLCGSHTSGYMLRIAQLLVARGYRAVRMNLRGAGPGLRFARRTYNATTSGDVRAAVEELHRWSPSSPIIAAGFSLGGALVLRMAGEFNGKPMPALRAVASISPPTDMEACSALLEKPGNRVYDRYFGNTLANVIRKHWLHFPDLPRVRFPENVTLRQFDNLHTAPFGGFADADDYYRKSGLLPFIRRIYVPTMILTAQDDPFIAPEPIAALPKMPHLEARIVPHGGHLGFLGFDGKGGVHWSDHRLVEWIERIVPARGKGFNR